MEVQEIDRDKYIEAFNIYKIGGGIHPYLIDIIYTVYIKNGGVKVDLKVFTMLLSKSLSLFDKILYDLTTVLNVKLEVDILTFEGQFIKAY